MTDNNGSTSVSSSSVATGQKQMLRIPLVTAGSISAILSLVLFIAGWTSGYLTFKSEMGLVNARLTELNAVSSGLLDKIITGDAQLQERLNGISKTIADDRQNSSNRLVAMETEMKYIGQGVAELRLSIVAQSKR